MLATLYPGPLLECIKDAHVTHLVVRFVDFFHHFQGAHSAEQF